MYDADGEQSMTRKCDPMAKPKQAERPKTIRTLKLFNGRWDGRKLHGNICAYTKKQAVELAHKAGQHGFSLNELNTYWSKCWGDDMAGISPEVGVWITQLGKEAIRLI